MAHLPETIDLPVFGTVVAVSLSLPFSWVAFYFASLFAVLGQLVFVVRCPQIIKNYPDWAFAHDTLKEMEIAQYFAELTTESKFWITQSSYRPTESILSSLQSYFDADDGVYT